MSEMNKALPWTAGGDKYGYTRVHSGPAIYDSRGCLVAETAGGFPDAFRHELIVTSVNARPKVEELVRMIKKSAEVAASKQNRQEAAAVVLDLVLPHLGDKAREVEAALKETE